MELDPPPAYESPSSQSSFYLYKTLRAARSARKSLKEGIKDGSGCLNCRVGKVELLEEKKLSFCKALLAICMFPLRCICCYLKSQKKYKCPNCGIEFDALCK